MLSETEIRKIKSDILDSIETNNILISTRQKEIDEHKKRIYILQAKLSEINKVLQDE